MFGDACEHLRADLDVVVESPDVIGKFGVTVPKFDMRPALRDWNPTDP
jgi:hypothetical protein